MQQGDLFPVEKRKTYPIAAGWQRTDTSHQAAEQVDVETWRARVLEYFKSHGPMTADEVAAALQTSILTIRPRVTELRTLGYLRDTWHRRRNQSGKNAIVWDACSPQSCPDCGGTVTFGRPKRWLGGFNQTITCTGCSYKGERSTRT